MNKYQDPRTSALQRDSLDPLWIVRPPTTHLGTAGASGTVGGEEGLTRGEVGSGLYQGVIGVVSSGGHLKILERRE